MDIRKSRSSVSERIFLFAFAVYLIRAVFHTTMLYEYCGGIVFNFVHIVLVVCVVIKVIFFDKYSYKQLGIFTLLCIVFLLSWKITGYNILFGLCFLILGSKNVSFRKVVNIYFVITLSIVLIVFFLSQIGIVENLIYDFDGVKKQAFGFAYTTDFAAHVFYLIVAFIYLKDKLSFLNILTFIIIAIFVYVNSKARLDSLSIVGIAIVFFIHNIIKKVKWQDNEVRKQKKFTLKILKVGIIFLMPICAILSIALATMYDNGNPIMSSLNEFSSNRISLGNKGISMYGFKLFGQYVFMQGFGMSTDLDTSNYFFIDSSYLNIALRYGVIVLIMVCMYHVYCSRKIIKYGNVKLIIIIIFITLNSVIAQHLLEIAYNPFILVYLDTLKKDYSKKTGFKTYDPNRRKIR